MMAKGEKRMSIVGRFCGHDLEDEWLQHFGLTGLPAGIDGGPYNWQNGQR